MVATAYLTSTKNLEGIFNAIRVAKAPQRFTVKFLEGLGFKASADRLVINVLKSIGLLNEDGTPTRLYFEFLDQTQSGIILAQALEEAYSDLFELNRGAHKMSRDEVKNKLKTITEGAYSDDVLSKMANTFLSLSEHADFDAEVVPQKQKSTEEEYREPEPLDGANQLPKVPLLIPGDRNRSASTDTNFTFRIEIVLPAVDDRRIYDAIFSSLKEHLLK